MEQKVKGHQDYLNVLWNCSDREADKAPTFEDARHTVYINYPESMLPDIEKILVNPGRVLCQIYFIDKVTVWATVESPVIERK